MVDYRVRTAVPEIMGGVQTAMQGYEQAQARDAQQAILAQGAELLSSGTPSQVAEWNLKNPGYSKQFIEAADIQDQFTQKPLIATAKEALSGQVDPKEAIINRIEEVESKGGQAPNLREMLNRDNPEEMRKYHENTLALYDPKGFKSYQLSARGLGLSPTASIKEFQMLDRMEEGPRKDAFARMIGAEDSIKIKGVEYKKNPLTNRYEAALDAASDVVGAQEKALADMEADKASRLDYSKTKTKWSTGRPKYESKIRGAKNDRSVMESTADEIRDTLNGYSAKYGSALKGLSGTDAQKLKGLYQTMLANSAFSTLISLKQAGGTLGAISSSELDLLKAKQGELNQSGQVEEQFRVLEQIMEANDKAIQNIESEYTATNDLYSGTYDEMIQAQEFEADALDQARTAIARGVSRDVVIQRLRENGVNASNL